MQISIGRPMSLAQPNILIAVDLARKKHLFIKLLRIPETTTSESSQSKNVAVTAEIKTCDQLSKANILGLVKCDVVEVTVHHAEGLGVSPGVWAALKMKRYTTSLTDLPQLPEELLYDGFTRVLNALKAMHALKLVHMDVKADNVFVDEDLNWDLGDFGSTRQIGAPIWSYTQVLTPYTIPAKATVIPAMDYVLLCVMIAVESKKEQWKQLCGKQQHVQAQLIMDRLQSIEDAQFKEEVVELFEQNLKLVREHLQK
jgi:serine/threonine protein kinase